MDRCFMLADSYLLSMAYIYMRRANYTHQQMTFFNLLVALYLAHEVEEDDLDIKNDLVNIAMGGRSPVASVSSMRFFISRRGKLWTELKYRVMVTRGECEQVMRSVLVGNYIWRRNRHSSHAGAPVPFHVKQTVYTSQMFRGPGFSFRCLYCEGFRYLAHKNRNEQLAAQAKNRALLGHHPNQMPMITGRHVQSSNHSNANVAFWTERCH